VVSVLDGCGVAGGAACGGGVVAGGWVGGRVVAGGWVVGGRVVAGGWVVGGRVVVGGCVVSSGSRDLVRSGSAVSVSVAPSGSSGEGRSIDGRVEARPDVPPSPEPQAASPMTAPIASPARADAAPARRRNREDRMMAPTRPEKVVARP
jgi:hypothetical protein